MRLTWTKCYRFFIVILFSHARQNAKKNYKNLKKIVCLQLQTQQDTLLLASESTLKRYLPFIHSAKQKFCN